MKSYIAVFLFLGIQILHGQNFWELVNLYEGGTTNSLVVRSDGYVFAGKGAKIYRSTNFGNQWQQVWAGANEDVIALACNYTNGYAYAGLERDNNQVGGVYRSTDNGASWSSVGLAGIRINDIAVTSKGTIVTASWGTCSGNPCGGIYRSTNNGSTWSLSLSSQYNVRTVTVDKNGYVYAGTLDLGTEMKALLLRSTDDGTTFSIFGEWIGFSSPQGITVDSAGNIFVVFGNGKLYKSSDQGSTWIEKFDGINPYNDLSVPMIINSANYLFVSSYGGGILSSKDTGNTWSWKNSGTVNSLVYSLAIDSLDYLYTGIGIAIYKSTFPTRPLNAPILNTPENNAIQVSLLPILNWSDVPAVYGLQLSTLENFSSLVLDNDGLIESQFEIPNGILQKNTSYYWCVNSSNLIDTSDWSLPFQFTTVIIPELLSPTDGADTTTTPVLMWNDVSFATGFRLQISDTSLFTIVHVDTIVYATQYQVSINLLNCSGWYYWRVKAYLPQNDSSEWSHTWKFKTCIVGIGQDIRELPSQFALYQSYPNPFNPSATIRFDIPKEELVVLKVYNVLGQEVATLLNERTKAGSYKLQWDASNYPTGLYMYRFQAGDFSEVKRMILLK